MAQLRKLGFQVELQTSAVKFFEFLKHDLGNAVQIFPERLKSFQIIDGNFSTAGSVFLMKYTIGNSMFAKLKIEAIDETEKTIVYDFIEGDMLNVYKSAKAKVQIADGSIKVEMVFEKANEATPDPDFFINFAAEVVNHLDNYLCKN